MLLEKPEQNLLLRGLDKASTPAEVETCADKFSAPGALAG
jgi:hypothetical protein